MYEDARPCVPSRAIVFHKESVARTGNKVVNQPTGSSSSAGRCMSVEEIQGIRV